MQFRRAMLGLESSTQGLSALEPTPEPKAPSWVLINSDLTGMMNPCLSNPLA